MFSMYHKSIPFLIPFAVAFVLFSAFFFTTYAQELTSSTTENTEASTSEELPERERPALEERGTALEERQQERSDLVEERQESRAEAIENRDAVRADRQAALTEIRQQRVLNLAANISNRMEAAISRLFNIVERTEGRIAKLKLAGVDTTAAESKLREAAQLLASARAGLTNIDTLVSEATSSPEPKSAWQNVRNVYKETGTQIRASHQALRETIALLKQALNQAENRPPEVATSTTETEETE